MGSNDTHRALVRRVCLTGAAGILLAALSACGGGGETAGGQHSGVIRAEAACDIQGLQKPLRQTLILVDAKAISKVANGAEFAAKNTAFRDVLLGIADPSKALAAGTTAARERITIAVVRNDGSPAQIAFTGCMPGMSASELAKANRDESTLNSIISSGPAAKLEEQAEEFRRQLIGGMVAAAALAEGDPSPQIGALEASPFLAGVRSSKGLFSEEGVVQRLVLYSDITGLTVAAPADGISLRKAGLLAGAKAGGDFGEVELHLVVPEGRAPTNATFLDGYFLAQGARLTSYGAGHLSNVTAPPVQIWAFAGKAMYMSGPELLEIRLGRDEKGKLVNSWMTMLGDPSAQIPMNGQIVCTSSDNCSIVSDKSGFAQAWSSQFAPNEPEFDNKIPFGGMRNFKFQLAGRQLSGEVYDDRIYLGEDTSKNSIGVTAQSK